MLRPLHHRLAPEPAARFDLEIFRVYRPGDEANPTGCSTDAGWVPKDCAFGKVMGAPGGFYYPGAMGSPINGSGTNRKWW